MRLVIITCIQANGKHLTISPIITAVPYGLTGPGSNVTSILKSLQSCLAMRSRIMKLAIVGGPRSLGIMAATIEVAQVRLTLKT